jgi:hypothetical protein
LGANYLVRDGSIVDITAGLIGSEDGYSLKEDGLPFTVLAPVTEPTVTAIITGNLSFLPPSSDHRIH